MKGARILAALPLVLATAGCIMPEQLSEYQKDVADVQQSLQTVSKSQAEVALKVAALEAHAGTGDAVKRSEIADLTARLDEIVRQTTANADRVDQVGVRVDRLSQDVQAARDAARRATPSMPPTAAPDTGAAPNPNALYTSAYADFSKGNYALAIQGFEEFAQRFPQTDLADNAMYWIGECHFSQGSYKTAITAFDTMLETYPRSDKAAAANLKKALAFVQMNQIGQGVEQLRYVTASYPGTDEARIANDRLASLGKP